MKDNNKTTSIDPSEQPAREPLFRRYQIKVQVGVKTGPLPTGRPPIGF